MRTWDNLKMLALLLYLALLPAQVRACTFPEFLQSRGVNNTMREWHSHLTYHGRETLKHYSLAAFFRGNKIRFLPYGGELAKDRPLPHIRQCLMQVTATTYLSRYTNDGGKDQFLCMEFVKRSAFVFQLKQSRLSEVEDPNLCSNLTMDHWVFVDKVNLYNSYTPCPLSGGYSTKTFDKMAGIGVCDGYDGETRIEVECIPGEGMTFLFRHANCVPSHVHMHITQQTYCMASWTHGKYVFTVLRHNKAEHMWCLRFPANRSQDFTAHLFKNLYCDPENQPSTNEYVVVDMYRDRPRGLDQLCVDDYEACDIWSKPCDTPGDILQLTCAKKCGICTEKGEEDERPSICTVPSRFRGLYYIRKKGVECFSTIKAQINIITIKNMQLCDSD